MKKKAHSLKTLPEWMDSTTQALLQALLERDPYTYGHCRRVGHYAQQLAKAAGFSEQDQQIISYSGILHDIGKIAIPDRVLLKPGRLTEEEDAIMRTHPVKSAEVIHPLCHHQFFDALIPGLKHHHERIDGQGYPARLNGENIPIEGRLLAIVDTFDAITTTRPYRIGQMIEVAYKEIKLFSGRQFDAHLVRVFLESFPKWEKLEDEITEEYIKSHFRRAA